MQVSSRLEQRREHMTPKIEDRFPHLSPIRECPLFDYVKTRIHQILEVASGRMRPGMKRSDARVRIDLDQIRVERMIIGMQQQSGFGAGSLMGLSQAC